MGPVPVDFRHEHVSIVRMKLAVHSASHEGIHGCVHLHHGQHGMG